MDINTVHNGDCLEVLKTFPDNSLDSIVTDPPYGLGQVKDISALLNSWMNGENGDEYVGKNGFMAKEWDKSVPSPLVWKECFRVLKPGGHALVFAGTRTVDLMAISLRLGGFEIREQIYWHYGQGFPKSMNLYKKNNSCPKELGTALKPSTEPICLVRKPLSEKTIVDNVLKHGTGGINIDDSRIKLQTEGEDSRLGGKGNWKSDKMAKNVYEGGYKGEDVSSSPLGRFPSNVILSHHLECVCTGTTEIGSGENKKGTTPRSNKGFKLSGKNADRSNSIVNYGKETIEKWECVDGCPVQMMDEQSGISKSSGGKPKSAHSWKGFNGESDTANLGGLGDIGGASRFYYCAKASKAERNLGLATLKPKNASHDGRKKKIENAFQRHENVQSNFHPTVKPVKLMEYLVTLITPKGGVCLDPFAGSGTTLVACKKKGFNYVGIEMGSEYIPIIEKRIAYYDKEGEDYLNIKTDSKTTQSKKKKVSKLSKFMVKR